VASAAVAPLSGVKRTSLTQAEMSAFDEVDGAPCGI
jgi:hypothetical protein